MNYYGDLLRVEGFRIYYSYGTSLDNMTGILMVDISEGTYTNVKMPDGMEKESCRFRSFANKALRQCMSGEIQNKISHEVG